MRDEAQKDEERERSGEADSDELPYLSATRPTSGAAKDGAVRARKIRPAVVELQPKERWTKRGRTESKAHMTAAWTRLPHRAARRRRERRRVITGGRL